MAERTVDEWKQLLRAHATAALKARDAAAASTFRQALSAIDQAEAVQLSEAPPAEPGIIAGGVLGLGRAEVARTVLSDAAVRSVLERDIAERRAAAAEFDRLSRPSDAARLVAEAERLQALLG